MTWDSSCSEGAHLVYRLVQNVGGGGQSLWQTLGTRPSISLGKCATVFQAEIYVVLVCVLEIHISVCSVITCSAVLWVFYTILCIFCIISM
jgi:hypothetical protein